MAADGSVVYEIDIKTAKAQNKLEKATIAVEKQTAKVNKLAEAYDNALNGKAGSSATDKRTAALEKQLDKQKNALSDYYRERAEIEESTNADLTKAENELQVDNVLEIEQTQLATLEERYSAKLEALKNIEQQLEKAIGERESESAEEAERLRVELEGARNELERLEIAAGEAGQQLEDAAVAPDRMQEGLEAAKKSIDKFGERLNRLARRVFVFTVIGAALRGMKSYIGDALGANEEFSKSLAQLKGTLRTAFQPVLDFVIPVLQSLINVLNTAVSYIARFTSWIFGTTVDASRAAAEALYDQANATAAAGGAAEKAKRHMSGLDEMNTWQSDSGGGSSGGSSSADVDFSAIDKIKSEISDLDVYIAGALFALGAILAFTGVSIPLGIALMLAGAMQIASALGLDWDTMPDNIKTALTNVMMILGPALLVIGAILAFSGANIPLGIALMLGGAAGLATVTALNWNAIKDKLTGEMAKYWGILFGGLFVVGLLLTFAGALPLGIALMIAGAAGLVTVTALNWNALLDKFKEVWRNITNWFNSKIKPKFTVKYWQEKFDTIGEGFKEGIKNGVNAAIDLLNKFVRWINEKLEIKIGNGAIAKALDIEPKTYKLIQFSEIPRLAQGAVIPQNREFLAVLGDQKYGRNLEAPESLIRQIVREESGRGNGGSGSYYEFVAKLNSKTLFDEVIEQAKIKKRVTGKNPFALGGT